MAQAILELQASKDILDLIDDMKAMHNPITPAIDLPQMVVCGDQSSGKSSLLRSITGVEFPVSDDVCTRFATSLRMRDTDIDVPSYTASILPAADTHPAEVTRLGGFSSAINGTADIAPTIARAAAYMGVASSGFSPHVLCIDIRGRVNVNLTLVDLPGLFNSAGEGQSTDDKEKVRELVISYISSPRTIIVHVMSAQLGQAQQNLGDLLSEWDPQGLRTFGVLTKPDCLDRDNQPTLAKNCLELLKKQDPYPWHVVKNRAFSQRTISDSQREAAENEFFAKGLWADIPENQKGAGQLQRRLCMKNLQHIVAVLPALERDIDQSLDDLERQVLRLPDYNNDNEVRNVLVRAGRAFGTILEGAIVGSYDGKFFDTGDGEEDASRLQSRLDYRIDQLRELLAGEGKAETTFEHIDDSLVKAYGIQRQRWPEEKLLVEVTGKLQKRNTTAHFDANIANELFCRLVREWPRHVDAFIDSVVDVVGDFLRAALPYAIRPCTYKGMGVLVSDDLKQSLRAKLVAAMEPTLSKVRGQEQLIFKPATINKLYAEANQLEFARQTWQQGPKLEMKHGRQNKGIFDLHAMVDVLDEQFVHHATATAIISYVDKCYEEEVVRVLASVQLDKVCHDISALLGQILDLESIQSLSSDDLRQIQGGGEIEHERGEQALLRKQILHLQASRERLREIRNRVPAWTEPAKPKRPLSEAAADAVTSDYPSKRGRIE